MMHEKNIKERKNKESTREDTKRKEKETGKIKPHFTCWEPNPRRLPALPPIATPPTTYTPPGLHILILILIHINKFIVHFIHHAVL
jgi:hypothetical protein